ncbi:MAG: M1 family metallopeptidase [Litorimonas sp.]
MKTFYLGSTAMLAAFMLTACGGSHSETGDAVIDKAKGTIQDTVGKPGGLFHSNDVPHAQLSGNVVPQEYRVDMRMDPDEDGFSGTVEIDVNIQNPTDKIWLHGKEMSVSSAIAVGPNGQETALQYHAIALEEAPSGVAYLTSEDVIAAGAATLKISYETPYNQALNSAYQVKRGGEGYIITQFEPLGAREAFPSFDEPKYKVPFTLSITAPQSDFVYSNTPEMKATTLDDGWVKHDFAKTRPLPTYLIAFGAGPYDVVEGKDIPPNSVRDYPLKLRGIGAAGQGGNFDYALNNTSGILTALEEYFGTPYPYEKLDLIAAPEYAFGAMENPGAIVYREFLLLLDENSPLSQKRAYAGVHSHELAHQWFGNLVTPVWWEDIWLNEAFATWMGNKGTAIWKPEGNYDRNTLNAALGAMNIDTLSTTRKVREPLDRSENVIDQFDAITYRKGGGVLSMFESYLGEDAFRDGVRLHMKRYADDVATGDDFFQSIADGSGNADVVDAMKSFVDQPGLPLVQASMSCDAGKAEVTFKQSRYAPLGSKTRQGQSWQIPVCAKFGYADGTSDKSCTLMKEPVKTQTVELDSCPAYIKPNENGSGYYRFSLDSAGWSALIDNLGSLNTREALTAQDSLVAAFRAGDVDADVFLAGQKAFAAHPEYDVASGSSQMLGFMYLQAPEGRAGLSKHVEAMYRKRFEDNRGKDTVEGNLLVPTLAGNLLRYGQSDDLRAEFVKNGSSYLGLDAAPNKQAVAGNLLRLALSETMRAKGEAAYAPLLEMAENGSAFEKGAALGALAQSPDTAIAERLRGLILDEDSPLTGRQVGGVLGGLLGSDDHGEDTWDWIKANFESYVTRKVPDVRKGSMPGLASGFCSKARRDEVETFFEANAATIPGYERSLAQVIESIELCTALKDAKAAELDAALKEL